jgi:hypothetical protein
MAEKRTATPGDTTVAGRTLERFAEEAGMGRSTFYVLPEDAWPEHVRIGKRIVITETPVAWLRRMKERGGVSTTRKARAPEPAAA